MKTKLWAFALIATLLSSVGCATFGHKDTVELGDWVQITEAGKTYGWAINNTVTGKLYPVEYSEELDFFYYQDEIGALITIFRPIQKHWVRIYSPEEVKELSWNAKKKLN